MAKSLLPDPLPEDQGPKLPGHAVPPSAVLRRTAIQGLETGARAGPVPQVPTAALYGAVR
jgi:hypothetical protein